MRAGIDDLGGVMAAGGEGAGTDVHFAVGEGRAVLDNEDALAGDTLGVVERERRGGEHDARVRIHAYDVVAHRLHAALGRGVDLVDDNDVGQAQVHLAGVIGQFVARAVGVGDGDREIGAIEGVVVVATVPDDDVAAVRVGFRGAQHGLVVDAGIDDRAALDVRLVFLHLLDGAALLREVVERGEALHPLRDEIAVGHGVAHDDDAQSACGEVGDDAATGLALAGAGARGHHRNHRLRAPEHGRIRPREQEIGTGRVHHRARRHHFRVGDVAVGEHALIDVQLADQLRQVGLGMNRNAFGVARAGEFRRIAAIVDVGDLCGGEGDHAHRRIVATAHVEVVKIPACGAEDDQPAFVPHASVS